MITQAGPPLRPPRRAAGVLRQPAPALHRLEGPQRRAARGRAAARALDLRVRRHGRRDRRGADVPRRGGALRVPRLQLHPARAARERRRARGGARRRAAARSSSSATCAATCTATRPGRRTARRRSRRWRAPRAARGYEYLCLTDHSHYLREGRLEAQWREIEAVNARLEAVPHPRAASRRTSARTARSTSPTRCSRELDWVVASVHTSLDRDPTERVLEAMENPYVDCIGHLTGRRIGRARRARRRRRARDREARSRRGTALEINGQPDRLDLRDVHARLAGEAGVPIADRHRRALDRGARATSSSASARRGAPG